MRAWVLEEFGGPLVRREVPVPTIARTRCSCGCGTWISVAPI
jgi:hypothetical protein